MLATLSAPELSAQAIYNVGIADGAYQSGAYGVSGNGAVVAVGMDIFWAGTAHRWTRSGGLDQLESLPGVIGFVPSGLNHNGSVVVGTSFFPDDSARAWRWTAAGGTQDLGLLPGGLASIASGVSGNGQVVAGYAFTGDYSIYAVRWTSRGGLQSLGTLPGGNYSMASAISDDGSTIVGQGDADGIERAFCWTARGGMRPLPWLSPDAPWGNAFGVNRNGQIVAGVSGQQAVIWVRGVPRDLGRLPGDDASIAFAVSGNGSVVGGYSFGGFSVRATLWTPATGLVDLNTYLPQLGVDLTGWDLQYVRDVSSGGRTIVGEGTFQGEPRGWVVKLAPGPDCEDDPGDQK